MVNGSSYSITTDYYFKKSRRIKRKTSVCYEIISIQVKQ